MRTLPVLIMFVSLAACDVGIGVPPTGDPGPGGVDAATSHNPNPNPNPGTGDAGAASDGGQTANACTGAAYDPCTDVTQCMTGMVCQDFAQQGIEVCSPSCTPGDNTTCPTQNGQPATCNNKGLCKPAAANSCSR